MTHEDVERQAVVERYVRGELRPDEAKAFEEHFFVCDACFANVQAAERLRAVRDAAERGRVEAAADGGPAAAWLRPAFGGAVAATILLVTVVGWLAFVLVPELRRQLAAEREARAAAERTEARPPQDVARAEGGADRLAAARAEPNVPVAILQSTRAAAQVTLAVPPDAPHVVLWIEAPRGARGQTFRLTIGPAGGAVVETIDGLTPNTDNAIAAAVPAARLPPGAHVAQLYSTATGAPVLTGEYRLTITRPTS